jgi:hypothetical protein
MYYVNVHIFRKKILLKYIPDISKALIKVIEKIKDKEDKNKGDRDKGTSSSSSTPLLTSLPDRLERYLNTNHHHNCRYYIYICLKPGLYLKPICT